MGFSIDALIDEIKRVGLKSFDFEQWDDSHYLNVLAVSAYHLFPL